MIVCKWMKGLPASFPMISYEVWVVEVPVVSVVILVFLPFPGVY